MAIELEEIEDTGAGESTEATGGEGESPGEGASDQLAAAERLDAELRGSLAGERTEQGDGEGEGESAGDESDESDAGGAEQDATTEPPEGDKKGGRSGWRWKGLREKERQLAQQQAELQAGYQTLAQREAAAKEYQEAAAEIKKLAATSPRAAARQFAKLTGQPADDLYQGWTEERLKGGTEAEHDKLTQVPAAVRQLLDEQAEQIRQLKEGQEKYTTEQQQQHIAAVHQRDCAQVLAVAAAPDEETGCVYPYLDTLPEAHRETYVSQGVSMAVQLQREDGVSRDHAFVAKRLDAAEMGKLQKQLQALSERSPGALQAILPAGIKVAKGGTSQDPVNPAGDATGRSQGRKRGGKRSPGNRAGAQSSTGARPEQSRAEYERQLDEQLRASMD